MPFSDGQDLRQYFACGNASESLRLARIFTTDGIPIPSGDEGNAECRVRSAEFLTVKSVPL
jgi:hypothetical protein